MAKIARIKAREILDSRGTPTIEVSILADNGTFATAATPSGSSPKSIEPRELRDLDPSRYRGMGVLKAIEQIDKQIAPRLIGQDPANQTNIDSILSAFDLSKIGTNTALALSVANIKLASSLSRVPLFSYLHRLYNSDQNLTIPGSIFNLINGGKHGAGNLDFQEFHIIPSTRYPFKQALQVATEIYTRLEEELIHRGAIHSIGDEGGFAPNLFTNTDALELLSLVIKNSAFHLNQDIFLGLDVAADSFFQNSKYSVKDSPRPLDSQGLMELYQDIMKQYGLFSLEDVFGSQDWDSWAKLKTLIPSSTLLVGDDLVMTNKELIQKSIEKQAINTVIIKPNQAGTITETISLIKYAHANKLYTILSHRSGETNDTFLADLAVGLGVTYTKFGAPIRGERVAKYNRLLEIESFLQSRTK